MTEQYKEQRPVIGLCGFGDLGSRLATQALWHGYDVHVYDPKLLESNLPLGEPLDPNLQKPVASKIGKLVIAESMQDVMNSARIVHCAISSKHLPELPETQEGQIVVLHDSVMHTSVEAINKRDKDRGRFAAAHCLTNSHRRVFILDDPRHAQKISEHFLALGLSPKIVSSRAHDKLMARTQGPLALLINAGLREYLAQQKDLGNLTPSGEHQKDALDDRAARWTQETVDSILRNPELPEVALYIIMALLKKTFSTDHTKTVANRLGQDILETITSKMRGTSRRFLNSQN